VIALVGRGPASKGYDCDAAAEQLMYLGRTARQMPRSYDSDDVTYRVDSGQGQIAKMLPGRGIMLGQDLRSLGITKPLPNVYEPSRFQRIRDTLHRLKVHERGAISTYDGIIASRGNGKANDIAFTKLSITTVASTWSTLWHAGGQPGAGTYLATTAPTDAVLDRASTGAISTYLSNPSGSDKKYLLTFGFGSAQQINMAVLVDVLNHSGLFRNTVNTAETVASPTNATRQYGSGSGVGNLMTLVCSVAGTGGAGTLTVQYVDQAAANTNAPALTTAASAFTADTLVPSAAFVTAGAGSFFIPLAAASTGVQAIKQTTLSVAGTGAGSGFAGNIFFPLSLIPGIASNAYIERDSTTQIDGITELIMNGGVIGHLALYALTNGTTSGALTGFIRTVSG
jgi:hypothetical protein